MIGLPDAKRPDFSQHVCLNFKQLLTTANNDLVDEPQHLRSHLVRDSDALH